VVSALLVGATLSVPARADTAGDLEQAKQQVATLKAELDRLNRAWLDAEAAEARAQDQASDARARIGALQGQLGDIQQRLAERATTLFAGGGNPEVLAVLASDSVTEAADRLEFASAIAQGDADLANEVAVELQELAWQRERLATAIEQQRAAQAQLDTQQAAIASKLSDYEARVSELEDRLAAEQAPPSPTPDPGPGGGGGGDTGTPPITGSGWLLMCPVNGPNSFVDSFGDPRPGGRTHQGIDLIAARGTPVVAVHAGTVHRTGSDIGGLGIVLFHDGSADWTFYTHFDHYGAYGEGAHVGAGQVIGYVGNTGTTVYHLHFEYHPGGGAAVDPYQALLGVC
jgi:peptidoglycan LD-endopeptidase LytH